MRRLAFIMIALFAILSCGNEENPIPNLRVYLNLDLTFEDRELKAIPSFKEYTVRDANTALGEAVGFGGVLVVHTMTDEYRAFDRACPFEANSAISVAVDDVVLYAVCPRCGTKYDIGFGTGAPSGASKHFLKQYNVIYSSNKLKVSN
ncbi:MAG: (2Fe-2S)-binding protein [Tannerella sp.]|jgi:nitrite reductase/ring-hydroxylating ferredoxin subunit|nr:(2Fe-2S)-binding protein [Tannerella sp.]